MEHININDLAEALLRGDLERKIFPTGIEVLDEALSGGLTSGITVLGGLPGRGKSSLAYHIIEEMSKTGKYAIFYNLEMPELALAEMRVRRKNRASSLNEDDNNVFYIVDARTYTVEDIVEDIRKSHEKEKDVVVVIDYLQLLRGNGDKAADKRTQINESLKELSDVANLLDIPIILISSLTRSSYNGEVKNKLGVFKESGEIEYEAVTILLLECDEKELSKLNRKCKIDILKNKYKPGSGREISVMFQTEYVFFEGYSIKNLH